MLLPLLGGLLRRAQGAAAKVARLEEEMQSLNRRIFLAGGMHVDVSIAARRRAERDKSAAEAKTVIAEMEEIGVRVQDLDAGVLDFPFLANGETVLLCWRLGEEAILHWHRAEDSVEQRRPVDTLFAPDEGERPN